jgi:hypothetical protein
MKIVLIEKVVNGIHVLLDNGEEAQFYKFGDIIYSVISEGLHKKEFKEFKENIIANQWDVDILKKVWIG